MAQLDGKAPKPKLSGKLMQLKARDRCVSVVSVRLTLHLVPSQFMKRAVEKEQVVEAALAQARARLALSRRGRCRSLSPPPV